MTHSQRRALKRAARRQRAAKQPDWRQVSDYFKWYFYSSYHPSPDIDRVRADFLAGKSLHAVYDELGVPWAPPPPDPEESILDPIPPATQA